MKTPVVIVFTALFFALPGCGGGSGAQPFVTQENPPPETPPPETPPPENPPPENPPPPAESNINFDKACAAIVAPGQGAEHNNSPAPGPAVDMSPGGFYTGNFIECGTIVPKVFHVIVSEDGKFRTYLYATGVEPENLLTCPMQTEGASFQCFGRWSNAPGVYSDLWLEGVISERDTIKGRWGNAWGSYGFFELSYTGNNYEWPTGMTAYQIEPELRGRNWRNDAQITWTVAPDGQFNGMDSTGCNYAGHVVNRNPQYILVETDFTVTDCAESGNYSGFATWYVWDMLAGHIPVLTFQVDDGEGRILEFNLSNGSWNP
jgi:hypothetical protein